MIPYTEYIILADSFARLYRKYWLFCWFHFC